MGSAVLPIRLHSQYDQTGIQQQFHAVGYFAHTMQICHLLDGCTIPVCSLHPIRITEGCKLRPIVRCLQIRDLPVSLDRSSKMISTRMPPKRCQHCRVARNIPWATHHRVSLEHQCWETTPINMVLSHSRQETMPTPYTRKLRSFLLVKAMAYQRG